MKPAVAESWKQAAAVAACLIMYSAWAWEKDARDVRGDTDRSHTSGFPHAPPDAPDITNGRTVEFDKQKKLHIDKLREKLKALKVELADKYLKDAAAKALKDAAAKTLKDADAKAAVVDVGLHFSLNPESDEDSLFANGSDAEDEKEIDKNGQHQDTASSDDSSDAQEKGEDAKAVQISSSDDGVSSDDGRSSSTTTFSPPPSPAASRPRKKQRVAAGAANLKKPAESQSALDTAHKTAAHKTAAPQTAVAAHSAAPMTPSNEYAALSAALLKEPAMPKGAEPKQRLHGMASSFVPPGMPLFDSKKLGGGVTRTPAHMEQQLLQPPPPPPPRPPASGSNSARVRLKDNPSARSHLSEIVLTTRNVVQDLMHDSEFGDRLYELTNERTVCGLHRDLHQRAAYCPKKEMRGANPQSRSPRQTPTLQPDDAHLPAYEYLPASNVIGNMMIGTWVIGKECERGNLAIELARTPWDLLILVMSSAITEHHDIYIFLLQLAREARKRTGKHREARGLEKVGPHLEKMDLGIGTVFKNKYVMCLTYSHDTATMARTFIVINRAKVSTTSVRRVRLRPPARISYSGPCDPVGMWLVELRLYCPRQNFEVMKVGIVDVRECMHGTAVAAVADCIVHENLDVLTGFFGSACNSWVTDLANKTHPISYTPVYQPLMTTEALFHPTFYMWYAYYKQIVVPDFVPGAQAWWLNLSADIVHDMVPVTDAPRWIRDDRGNALVQNVGSIKMKPLDWGRWIGGVYQTIIWLGTALPSNKKQYRKKQAPSKDAANSRASASTASGSSAVAADGDRSWWWKDSNWHGWEDSNWHE